MLLSVAAAASTACVASEPATDVAEGALDLPELHSGVEVVTIDGTDPRPTPDTSPRTLAAPGEAGPEGDNPCDCTTEECLQAWAQEHLGCGFCMVLVCEDGPQHLCIVCDP